jgi:hypothetical protein
MALPKLAGLQSQVTLVFQNTRKRRDGPKMLVHPLATSFESFGLLKVLTGKPRDCGWIVAGDLVLVRKATRKNRRQTRTTQTRRDIPTSKGQTLAGKPIQVGSPQVSMSHETVIGPSLIVRDDQNDIGPLASRLIASGLPGLLRVNPLA